MFSWQSGSFSYARLWTDIQPAIWLALAQSPRLGEEFISQLRIRPFQSARFFPLWLAYQRTPNVSGMISEGEFVVNIWW